MKSIQQTLGVSLLPLLAASSALAQNVSQTDASQSSQNAANASKADRSNSWRASELLGTNVRNKEGDTVGEVKDLVVNLQTQEVVAVIISAGGFLGIGDTLSSVPVSTLKYDGNEKILRISLSKSQLEKQPQFKSGTWPDPSDDSYDSRLRGPRDSGDAKAPDNTANNEREMKENHATPTDQGNNETDLTLTKNIRSSIVGADLSFNAKNIKIITTDGKVTLRGVVESEAEHQTILNICRAHADSSKITDDLKLNTK